MNNPTCPKCKQMLIDETRIGVKFICLDCDYETEAYESFKELLKNIKKEKKNVKRIMD